MSTELISTETIETKIFLIRGKKVMLDKDLAKLYDVPIHRLNEQVKRNLDRFPEDFMFCLSSDEADSLRSQIAILKRGKHRKYLPYVFTEQGVAMLSSVLNSKRAIHVNIQIMRTFTKLREMIENNKDLRRKIEEMESKYDAQFKDVFDVIKRLIDHEAKPKRKIGFYVADEEIKSLKNLKGIKFYED